MDNKGFYKFPLDLKLKANNYGFVISSFRERVVKGYNWPIQNSHF